MTSTESREQRSPPDRALATAPAGAAPVATAGAAGPPEGDKRIATSTRVERLLQILMGSLATVGTLLLGMGQHDLLLPVFMLLAVTSSIVLTDTLGWFRLPRALANLAAIVAVGFSLTEFFAQQDDTQRQLLAIAHLLIYLQIVLLYQRKSDRIYWQLAVLSLLQVVVAAALNVGFEFGVVLAVFCVVALSALAVFFVHRTASRFRRGTASSEAGGTVEPSGKAGNEPGATPSLLGAAPRAEPQADCDEISRELLGWGFARHVLGLGLATIIFTAVFFYCTPRIVGSGRGGAIRPVVGFTNEVELNELGRISQSSELVMRVHFSDMMTRKPYPLLSEPYFRGMILNDYVAEAPRPKWRHRRPPVARPPGPLPEIKPQEGLVLQEILLQPRTEGLLFGVAPARRLASFPRKQDIVYDPDTDQLFRGLGEELKLRVPFRYLLVTDAFHNGMQQGFRLRYLNPRQPQVDWLRLSRAHRMLLDDYDPARFPRLSALAAEIVSQPSDAPPDALTKARLLQNYFRNSDGFRYTLDFRDVPRTPGVDPIEDFVANHRSGHCEYFASALTMMLRSQGVPARMVVGYRGGEFNRLGGYYQVRQDSAHAWVEAFIDRDSLPETMREDAADNLAGAWLRLDPTPGSSLDAGESRENSLAQRVGQAFDYAQLLWSDYVLGLTPERQQQAGLRTFDTEETDDAAARPRFQSWLAAADQWLQHLGLDIYNWRLSDWFSWRAGLVGMTLAALVLLCYRLGGALWRNLAWPSRAAKQGRVRQTIRVDFYERLETILRQHGLQRQPQQTQREFVLSAAERLPSLLAAAAGESRANAPSRQAREDAAVDGTRLQASRANGDGANGDGATGEGTDGERVTGDGVDGGATNTDGVWSDVLRDVVERFYEVRFGQGTLDKPESEAIEHALERLERALSSSSPR